MPVMAWETPARLSAQVISGIGFLGAGTIIVTRRNQIKGADHGGNPLGHCLHGAGCRRRVFTNAPWPCMSF